MSNNNAAKCQQKPAQPRAAEFHSLRRIKINDNSSQVSNFHFQISTLMSKHHAHEQKLLVLFRTPSPQRPPGTNYQQLITCIWETANNHYKNYKRWKNVPTPHIHPPRQLIANWRKWKFKYSTPPPFQSYWPAKTKQKILEKSYCPATPPTC